MAVFNMIEEADATGKVKEVFEDTVSYTHLTLPTNGCV